MELESFGNGQSDDQGRVQVTIDQGQSGREHPAISTSVGQGRRQAAVLAGARPGRHIFPRVQGEQSRAEARSLAECSRVY